MKILEQVYLEAESPQHAWYQLRMIQLSEGFVIEKQSGSRGHKRHTEAWFRWEQKSARKFYDKILCNKSKPGRARIYHRVSQQNQLELFQEGTLDT